MKVTINWIQLLVIPIWVYAFVQTWGTDLFLVIILLALKDLKTEIGRNTSIISI